MSDFNNIPLGLNVPTQIPLNVKEYVANEVTLSSLGTGNNLAYTYIDGLRIYCIQQKTIWEWQEKGAKPVNSGLLATGDFTYPNNIVTFGITYSNKIYNFYKVEYVNKTDEKSYDATSLGTGETIYKDKTVAGNNTVFNFKEINTVNAGTTGIPVLNGISTAGNDIIISGKRLKTTNLEITEPVAGEILINSPVDPNDVKFYVNVNYTGGGSNGSLSKPYTNLKDAFTAFRGSGTDLVPQYANIGTIELLSDVTIPLSGATSMTYLSINTLKLKGNGFTIYYNGSQTYFISTEYLVNLDAKDGNGKLLNNISMSFENVTIVSNTKHQIVNHLNYKSPTTPGFQKASSISFKNCNILDYAFLEDLVTYEDTTIDLFGQRVYAQNSLNKNQFTVKTKDVNWNGEGSFEIIGTKIVGSCSTIFYNLNSSIVFKDCQILFQTYYRNYKDKTGSIYNPIDGVYNVLCENNGLSGRPGSYIRFENLKNYAENALSGGSIIGGGDSFYRGVGNSQMVILDGYIYAEKYNNLIQLNNTNSEAYLNNLICKSLTFADATYGTFKYTGTPPVSRINIDVEGSTISGIKNWTTLQFIKPVANSALINGSIYSDVITYVDNAAAIAGGLIPGNIYYVTGTKIATRVV